MKNYWYVCYQCFTTLMASAETRSYRIESFSCKTYVTGVWSVTWSTPESSNLILSMK